jgi:hypothetical protein
MVEVFANLLLPNIYHEWWDVQRRLYLSRSGGWWHRRAGFQTSNFTRLFPMREYSTFPGFLLLLLRVRLDDAEVCQTLPCQIFPATDLYTYSPGSQISESRDITRHPVSETQPSSLSLQVTSKCPCAYDHAPISTEPLLYQSLEHTTFPSLGREIDSMRPWLMGRELGGRDLCRAWGIVRNGTRM